MRVTCPHCKQDAIIRDSEEVTASTREYRVICGNPYCGHTWVAHFSAVRTLAPSMTPDPKVYIPLSTQSNAARAKAAEDQGSLFESPPPRLVAAGLT